MKSFFIIFGTNNILFEKKTDCGKDIKVIFAGHLNRAKGPDFRNAIIDIDGTGYKEILKFISIVMIEST